MDLARSYTALISSYIFLLAFPISIPYGARPKHTKFYMSGCFWKSETYHRLFRQNNNTTQHPIYGRCNWIKCRNKMARNYSGSQKIPRTDVEQEVNVSPCSVLCVSWKAKKESEFHENIGYLEYLFIILYVSRLKTFWSSATLIFLQLLQSTQTLSSRTGNW